MRFDLQLKIRSNKYYQSYIREVPIWYKYLNRHPEWFPEFEYQTKQRYKITLSDRINGLRERIDFLLKLLSIAN